MAPLTGLGVIPRAGL